MAKTTTAKAKPPKADAPAETHTATVQNLPAAPGSKPDPAAVENIRALLKDAGRCRLELEEARRALAGPEQRARTEICRDLPGIECGADRSVGQLLASLEEYVGKLGAGVHRDVREAYAAYEAALGVISEKHEALGNALAAVHTALNVEGPKLLVAIDEAMRPLVTSATAAIRPFCQNDAEAKEIAESTSQVDVANLEDIHHGPRQAKLNGAWIPRDYSDIGPGEWYQSDDCTLPCYFFEETPEGVRAMRGQFLLMVDVATGMILGFALHSQEQYNARIIRSLILTVHDTYGLPREGFYFENGLWKKSRVLKGRPGDEVTLDDTEKGLREFVQFKHAKLPRAKVVERILGLLQNEAEPMPGYVGRNERVEKFERIQKQLLQAAAGKIAHGSFLLHKEQWTEKLTALCEKYNAEAQGGRLQGSSPREAFERDFDYRRGVTHLPAAVRYLLANHRRVEKVSKNGVRIVSAGRSYFYRSADTSRLIGQQVLVWHDVDEAPDSVTITDKYYRNAVEVPRVDPLPSMTATAEQLGAAARQAAAHGSYQRTLYRTLKPYFARSLFRPVQVDAATIELGQKIAAGRAEIAAEGNARNNVARRVAATERALGLTGSRQHRNPSCKLAGLEAIRLADELERQERE